MSHIESLDNDQEYSVNPTISFNFIENLVCPQNNKISSNCDNNSNIVDFGSTINYINEKEEGNNELSFNNDNNSLNKTKIGTPNTNYINLSSTISFSKSKQIKDIELNLIRFNTSKENNKEKIFRITKDNKNIGRIKKNSNLIGKHDKFSEDNIIRKFKGRFHEKCRIYINNEYKRYLLNHKRDIKNKTDLLQRISPKISRKIKKEENLKWLEMKLKQVFSENVSQKCSLYPADYNKKNISKLFQENKAQNVINVLNRPIKEMLGYFINNIEIPGFDTLNKDIIELEEKMKNNNEEKRDKYLAKYKKTTENFEYIFINKNARNNK